MTLTDLFAEAEQRNLDVTAHRIADAIGPTKFQVVILTNSRRVTAIRNTLEAAADAAMEEAGCAG